jgi:dipeptidyl aminopeptidase/acylaminoacyl peptidase
VPLSQGRELYNALRRQGVTVEMDIYPRQGHGPTEPRIIMDIIRRNLEWFDRWVK